MFRKVIKSNINHTFDVELRHVAIIDAYVEASLISVSWRNRSTVRRRISRYRTHGIATKYIASNFSLHAQKRHPHVREVSTKLFQLLFFFPCQRSWIAHSSSWAFYAQLDNKSNSIFIENLETEEKKREFPVLEMYGESFRGAHIVIHRTRLSTCTDKWRCRRHRHRVHLHRTRIISQRPHNAKRTRCYFCVRVDSAMCRNVELGE